MLGKDSNRFVINEKIKARPIDAQCNLKLFQKICASWDVAHVGLFSPTSMAVLRWEPNEDAGVLLDEAAPDDNKRKSQLGNVDSDFAGYKTHFSKDFKEKTINIFFIWSAYVWIFFNDLSLSIFDLDGAAILEGFYFDKSPIKQAKFCKSWLLLLLENQSFIFLDAKNTHEFVNQAKTILDCQQRNDPTTAKLTLPLKKWAMECQSATLEDIVPLHSFQTHCVSDDFRVDFMAAASSEAPEEILTSEEGHTFLIVGKQPSIGIFHSDQIKTHSLLTDGVIKLASTMSKVFSLAKSKFSRQEALTGNQPSSSKATVITSNFPKISSAASHLLQHFEDNQRVFTKIHDKFDRFVLISDNFGRLLLFDTKACLVVKLWKGFRGVHAFLMSHFKSLFCCVFSPVRKTFHYWKIFGDDETSFAEWDDCPLLTKSSSQPNDIAVCENFTDRKLFYSITQSKLFWFEN